MKRVVITFMFFQIFISGYTQKAEITQSIRGIVIDKYSHETLVGASVVVPGSDPLIGTTTDVNGAFQIEGLQLGRHSLKISYIGYLDRIITNLNLISGKQIVLNIELEESVNRLKTVTIKATSDKTQTISEMATVSARTFTVEETERFAGSLGDPSRMASHYAGVSMVNDKRNDIIIRGNSPSTLLWRLDGIEIPNPNHFGSLGTTGGPVNMLNNNLLTNSDFFTGAFPAEYGNAISGVFDLKMRSGNNQKHEFVGQIGFNGFEIGAEGPFVKGKNASYLINYRYSTLQFLRVLGIKTGIGQAIPQYQDLSFKIDVPTQKWGRFSFIGMGGLSYIELLDSEKFKAGIEDADYTYGGVDLSFGSDMGVLGLKNVYFLNKNTRIETILSVQGSRNSTHVDSLKTDENHAIIEDSQYFFYHSTGDELKYSIASHFKKKFNAKSNFSTGFYYDLYQMNMHDSILNFGHYYKLDNKSLNLIRGYVQFQYRFTDRLTLNTGLYTQGLNLNDEISIEPRIGMKYQWGNGNGLSFGYGKHSSTIPRMTYFIETKLPDSTTEMKNYNVKMIKSHQWVVGYDKLLSENFRIKTEIYYQSLYDVPVTEDFPQFSILNTGDSFEPEFNNHLVNKGSGTNYGAEFTIEKFLSSGYYFLITSSFFESKYKGYDEIERNTSFNGNFVVNALGGYEIKIGKYNRITFDISSVYAGGKRYVPIDLDASIAANHTRYYWDEAYENRYDDYFRLDMRIGFKMNLKKYSQEWALDLQNLTNNQNIYRQTFNPRSQKITTEYQIGFFPMFLYRIQF
jgi:hypothetical protein